MQRPHKVASLVLCNSFISTRLFADNAVFSSAFQFMPAFYLKSALGSCTRLCSRPVRVHACVRAPA